MGDQKRESASGKAQVRLDAVLLRVHWTGYDLGSRPVAAKVPRRVSRFRLLERLGHAI
jgi:hypothetical protein